MWSSINLSIKKHFYYMGIYNNKLLKLSAQNAFIFHVSGNKWRQEEDHKQSVGVFVWMEEVGALIMYFLNLDFWHAVMMKIVKCSVLHGINALV